MRRKLTTVAVAGALGVAGLTGVAAAAESAGHAERIAQALRPLVADGTLDQAQADAVAEALAQRAADGPDHPGPGHGRPDGPLRGGPGGLSLAVAGEVLAMTPHDLRTALRSGATLGELALERDVAPATLVDALVQAAQHRLDDAARLGRLSPERAEALSDGLEEHVLRYVEQGARAGRADPPGHHRSGSGSPRPGWR